jgi:hypothetical protein
MLYPLAKTWQEGSMGKRLGYLMWIIAGVVGIGFNIRDAYYTTRVGLPAQVWTAIAFALVILGTVVVVHYRDVEFQQKLDKSLSSSAQNIILQPKTKLLSRSEQIVIRQLNELMERMHGHDDSNGIETDYRNGIDPNDILKRNCTHCNKPRNQKGDYYV